MTSPEDACCNIFSSANKYNTGVEMHFTTPWRNVKYVIIKIHTGIYSDTHIYRDDGDSRQATQENMMNV